jgi:hypothetical protein
MPHVVLINPFEVPEGKDEEFLAEWEAAKAFMERQPGYIVTRLHRSLVCFARKVCHFAMKGLPLSLPETTSGFLERSTEA